MNNPCKKHLRNGDLTCPECIERHIEYVKRRDVRVFFMSNPKTKPTDIRSYIVREPGKPSALIRITPNRYDPATRTAVCDCGQYKAKISIRCFHIETVDAIDYKKFVAGK